MSKSVLLHICCGVCAFTCVERLKEEGFFVTGFFFNPNIQPFREYRRRKEVLNAVRQTFGIEIIEGEYKVKDWFNLCGSYAQEREGGRRCTLCFELRLKETFKVCKEKKYNYFTTTLTVSPHKKSQVIMEMGRLIGERYFLERDFKKKDGFLRTRQWAKSLKVYQQDYCGCIYSLRERKGCKV